MKNQICNLYQLQIVWGPSPKLPHHQGADLQKLELWCGLKADLGKVNEMKWTIQWENLWCQWRRISANKGGFRHNNRSGIHFFGRCRLVRMIRDWFACNFAKEQLSKGFTSTICRDLNIFRYYWRNYGKRRLNKKWLLVPVLHARIMCNFGAPWLCVLRKGTIYTRMRVPCFQSADSFVYSSLLTRGIWGRDRASANEDPDLLLVLLTGHVLSRCLLLTFSF